MKSLLGYPNVLLTKFSLFYLPSFFHLSNDGIKEDNFES